MPIPFTDEVGREVLETKPEQPTSVGDYARKWSSLISSMLDIDTVIRYLQSAESGNLRYQMEMFDRMIERDPHLQSVLQTRRQALTQAEWSIVPGDETDKRAIVAADDIRDQLANIDGFDDDVQSLLDAVPKGIACSEIVFNGDWSINRLSEVPQKLLDWTQLDLRILTDGYRPEPMEPNKFIVHTPRIRPGQPLRRGLMRTLSILWCIAHFAMEDWAGYAEVFGQPLRLGKYPSGMNSKSTAVLWEALKKMGSDACGMIPEGMDIEFPEPESRKMSGNEVPMSAIIKYIERKVSILVLGQHLSTEAESGTGTLAGGAQKDVKQEIIRGDGRQVGTTLRRDLFRPVVGFRYGFDVPLPHIKWALDDPVDQESRAKVFLMARDMGQPVSMAQVREELDLREPEDEADTLRAPEQMPALMESMLATTKPKLPIGSAMRANHKLAAEAAKTDAGEQVLDLIDRLAETVETPEQLQTRIGLAAPNITDLLKAAGMDVEEFEDLCARTLTTSDLNGRLAVRGERDV